MAVHTSLSARVMTNAPPSGMISTFSDVFATRVNSSFVASHVPSRLCGSTALSLQPTDATASEQSAAPHNVLRISASGELSATTLGGHW